MPTAGGLYYELHGPEDAPPLVLSAGLGGSASYWVPNIEALSQYHRIIAYDHRGTGRSDRTLPDSTSIEDMAADVILLLDALGVEQTNFLGHALGGLIGAEIAFIKTRIRKLIVVNGWRAIDPHTQRCFDVRLDILRDSGPAAYLRAQPLFLYPPDWISSHNDALDAQAAEHLADFPGREIVEKRIAALRAYTPEFLDLITAELLVIATRDDMLVPVATALDFAAPVDWAKSVTLDWGGHACNVTDPDTFNRAVLDFLRS